MIIAAVTGGRRDAHGRTIILSDHQRRATYDLCLALDVSILIHGAAIGTDQDIARAITRLSSGSILVIPFPVDPVLDGPWPAAGYRRNRRMLEWSKAEVVIALPGGKGTAGCVAE